MLNEKTQVIYLHTAPTTTEQGADVVGTKLGEIMNAEAVPLSGLSGKAIAIDAFNTLYQFLSIIRQPDGTPLMDHRGRVTSHLSGLFYRNLNLLENRIRPVYVFDGEAPRLKAPEVARRRAIRDAAYEDWVVAKDEGRTEEAFKAAQASSRLTDDMIVEAKRLLDALGIPCIQAPSEGEALAAQMAREGSVWASASQDNDSLLYNCPRMIRNLSISGRRRAGRSKTYRTISPEIIDLDMNLKLLKITREQLIDIAILVGTDYNDKVPGVGAKTALKLVREHGSLEEVVRVKALRVDFPISEIRQIFLNPPKQDPPKLKWSEPREDSVCEILCKEHDFSDSRVKSSLGHLRETIDSNTDSSQQSSLADFM
jgi:flap endonuclease-1